MWGQRLSQPSRSVNGVEEDGFSSLLRRIKRVTFIQDGRRLPPASLPSQKCGAAFSDGSWKTRHQIPAKRELRKRKELESQLFFTIVLLC